jgi:hypothetical protein
MFEAIIMILVASAFYLMPAVPLSPSSSLVARSIFPNEHGVLFLREKEIVCCSVHQHSTNPLTLRSLLYIPPKPPI